jgi:caa(3)-type oxidase subunit IV
MSEIRTYVATWVILVVVTIAEVLMLGAPMPYSLVVFSIAALAIVKAILIALYYQHLAHEPGSLSLLPLYAVAMLAALIVISVIGGVAAAATAGG